MMFKTKILILITAIIAISEEAALGVNVDTDRLSARVSDRNEMSDTLSYMKRIVPNHDELYFPWPIQSRSYMLLPSTNDDTINTKPVVNNLGNRRERRQVLVKTKGSGDGPDSVKALSSVSSSLKSMLKNRRRRSSSNLGTSTNKNTTEVVNPTLVNSETSKFSESKHVLISLMTALTSLYPPYIIFPPINWKQVDNIFT
ncbi:hypothetical protein ACI65C_004114 [Semiaphis heraclei]